MEITADEGEKETDEAVDSELMVQPSSQLIELQAQKEEHRNDILIIPELS